MNNGNNILSWRINKITDANGNYMTFDYWSVGNNELVINSISYSGNAGNNMQPYASVHFGYREIPDNLGKNTCFLGGYGVAQTRLLETITILYNNTRIRKYKFNYNLSSSEQNVHLKEVVLYGETDAVKLNETVVTWEDQTATASPYQGVLQGFEGPYNTGYILPGDFNGDGYTDYVVHGCSNGAWYRYMYNPDQNKFDVYGPYFAEPYTLFYKADLEGIGKDQLFTGQPAANQSTYIFKISTQTGIKEFEIPNFVQLYFGDFDGDGKTDILFMSRGNNNNCTFKLFRNNNLEHNTGISTPNFCKVIVGDFTGNGKTDVEVLLNNNTLNTYWYNGSNFVKYSTPPNPQPTPNYYSERYSGDFNGDGISDLLVYEHPEWKLYFGKGGAQNYTDEVDIRGILSTNPEAIQKVIIADLNGDGKDDIIQLAGNVKIFYSKGFINGEYKYKPHGCSASGTNVSLSIADFNNDGNMDIYVQSNQGKPTIHLLNGNKKFDYPVKITDGIGKKIAFTYKPTYFPAKDFSAARGLTKKYFKFLLSELKVSNGINDGFNTFTYQYDFPAFTWLKRSFLGFLEFVCINVAEDKTKKNDLFDFSFNPEKHVLVPNTHKTYYNQIHYATTDYGISLKDLGLKRYLSRHNSIVSNKITGIKIITTDFLHETSNRVIRREIQTLDDFNYRREPTKTLLLLEKKYYEYQTISVSNDNNQKKTVFKSIITTKDYEECGILLPDTLTYSYTSKGNVAWERKGNIHGAITTSYGSFLPTGVYCTKTVSAKDCQPRIENYTYDATSRFVATIKNPLNHTTIFAYDPGTGNKTSETDPNGLTTTYNYDSFGNLTKITYPDATKTNYSINWYTNAVIPNARYYTQTSSTVKPTVTIYYDVLGREVCRKDDIAYFDTRYNDKGQVIKTSYPYTSLSKPDSEKMWKAFTYDDYGRKTSERTPYTYLVYDYTSTNNNNSRKVTVYDALREVYSWKDYDALERIIEAKDEGGEIKYHYEVTANKLQKTTIVTGSDSTKILIDMWGNRQSISEPNAGTISYHYNRFNELELMLDARYNQTEYLYDMLGRVIQKKITDENFSWQTTNYNYDTAKKGVGKLSKIVIEDSNITERFTYDNLSRLSTHTKTIGDVPFHQSFTHTYSYNSDGQLQTLTYPDNFSVTYYYHPNGKINGIKRSSDNSIIYQASPQNEFGAPTTCTFGKDLATSYTYNPCGLVTTIKSGIIVGEIAAEAELSMRGGEWGGSFSVVPTILNYSYTYNNLGLISGRSEAITKRQESFTYDNLDRLTSSTFGTIGQPGAEQTLVYQNNGNIANNSHVGAYTYTAGKRNAVSKITPVNQNVFSPNNCAVTYNSFNQPSLIEEGDRLELQYGADQQRNWTIRYQNNNIKNVRYYVSKYYEKDISYSPTITRHYHFIYGDNSIVALHITNQTAGTDSMYYVHTDHLGSICAITNTKQQVRQRNWFDPWGNSKENNFTITDRGFTGHEHYPYFKIINMNGRLYDPVIGRFFSPDNFVQMPEATQSYNRYSYCLNNPLKYTDPSGQAWRQTYDEDHDGNRIFNGYEWVDETDSYDQDGNLLPGLYSQALFFSDNGTFDDNSSYNIGSSTVTVYLSDGTTMTLDACTNPSSSNFPTLSAGIYHATVGTHQGKYTALKLSTTNNGSQINLGAPNPADPNRTYAEGINIHKAGLGNLTGMTSDNTPVSAGCLLIDRDNWPSFIGNFDTDQQRTKVVSVTVSRSMSTPVNTNRLPAFNFMINGTRRSFFHKF